MTLETKFSIITAELRKEITALFEITLITVGKLKEKFYISAAEEYEKRMRGYCQFRIMENQPVLAFTEDSLEKNEDRGGHGSTGKQ